MYLHKVYIRHREQLPDSHNTFAAWEGFRELGVKTVPYYGFGDIETFEDLGPEVGLVGFLGDVWEALKKAGKPRPTPCDYPEELSVPWLGRKVWRTTLGVMRRTVQPTFIKPVEEKLFTGFIWRGGGMEAVRIADCGDDTPIWASEIIHFESEHRVYVKDEQILDVRRYKGDWAIAPDREMVESAVRAFQSAPRAYSLDFGITKGGRTLLVEVNDGYALGCYGMQPALYAQMLEARWEELTR